MTKPTKTPETITVKIEAYGVKGLKSTPWRKVFKSQAAFEKWMEAQSENVELRGVRDVEG